MATLNALSFFIWKPINLCIAISFGEFPTHIPLELNFDNNMKTFILEEVSFAITMRGRLCNPLIMNYFLSPIIKNLGAPIFLHFLEDNANNSHCCPLRAHPNSHPNGVHSTFFALSIALRLVEHHRFYLYLDESAILGGTYVEAIEDKRPHN